MSRCTELWAVLTQTPGQPEGIFACEIVLGMTPFVSATEKVARVMLERAKQVMTDEAVTMRLVRCTVIEDVEVVR